MPIVAMPDGTQVSFPDDMARDQIRSLILQKFPDAGKQAAPGIVDEIVGGVGGALKSAASNVADYLNPFSEARHASYAKQAAAPLGEALGENLSQLAGTGAALAAPVTAPMAVAGEAITPFVARPFQALNQAAGIDLPYEQAKEQAATALMGAAPRVASPIGMKTAPAPLTAQELKAAGTAVYEDPGIKDIQIPVSAARSLSAKIENDLVKNGSFRPATEKPTFDVVREIAPKGPPAPDFWTRVQAEMNGEPLPQPPTVKSVSVADLMRARHALGRYAKEMQPAANGAPTKTQNAVAATRAIEHIDEFLGALTPELKTANADYSAGKALSNLDYRKMRADRAAAKTGSGSNIENTMRQQADLIPTKGLRPEEKAQLDKIVLGTKPRNALRKIGKLGFGDGLSLMYHAALTLPTLGINLPVGLAATGARKVGEALTRKQMNALGKMIAARAPLAQQPRPQIPVSSPNPLLPFILGFGAEEQ